MWLLKKLFKYQLEKLSLEKDDIILIRITGKHSQRVKREVTELLQSTGNVAIFVNCHMDEIKKMSDDELKQIGLQRI